MIYAIIVGGLVKNIIQADAKFVEQYYPSAVKITGMAPMPGIGWSYMNGTFTAPTH